MVRLIPLAFMEPFKRGWITSGGSELWDNQGTYSTIPYDRLPAIGEPSDDFQWLNSVSPGLRGLIQTTDTLDNEENELSSLEKVLEECAKLGLKVPTSFRSFLKDSSLHAKIPTCTDCYLSLSERLVPTPGIADNYLLRFLNDSQACVLWYLCLSRDSDPYVIASFGFMEPDIFEAMEYEDLRREYIARESLFCANTFNEFLYRFWIENTIWYSYYKKIEMTPMQRDYVSRAKSSQ